jgi:pimeloyl-ACP methyl ester carboxylesterase
MLTVNGASLYYEEHGSEPQNIVFSHGCLLSCRMFDAQAAAFKDRARCVAFDFRGQGRSETTRGGYDMDTLTEDAAALIQQLGLGPCHWVGSSMGGFVGLRLAVRHASLLRSLVLVGSSATREPHPWRYRMLNLLARCLGVRAVTRLVMPVQFSPRFLHDPARAEDRQKWYDRIASNSRIGGTRAVAGLIARLDFSEYLESVRVPTLIVAGEQDQAIPSEESRKMHARIAGSELVIIPGAGHAVTIEEPEAVNAALSRFLDRVGS